jgi:hypothetical protein
MPVHRPERDFAEFEAGNLTLNVMDAEAMGLPPSPCAARAVRMDP